MQRLAFIGLGAMGLPMARQLVTRGFPVHGFDLRAAATADLAAAGGRGAPSAREAATNAEALVLMVVNAAQAADALFEAGALEALAPNAVVILMATCAPEAVQAVASRVAASGRGFIDAPVSGGMAAAGNGTLTIMASGSKSSFAAAEPILRALGDKLFHVGESPGQGSSIKVLNQLLCGVHIAAAAEMMAFAAKMGVDPAIALEILSGSAASSWMLRDRGPRMQQSGPPVKSAVDIFVKDLGIVLDTGRQTKSSLPLAAAAHQMFLSASGRGEGKADDSQVVNSYRILNGTV